MIPSGISKAMKEYANAHSQLASSRWPCAWCTKESRREMKATGKANEIESGVYEGLHKKQTFQK